MIVLETTNHCLDDERNREFVQPKSIITPFRAMLANRMADTGKKWAEVFAMENSGTQNNQWMVVDYKVWETLLQKKSAGGPMLQKNSGLFTVLEQMPGISHSEDLSATLLRETFWSSFNTPYFETIQKISLYEKASHLPHIGFFFSHKRTPRARLFARDHGKVVNEKTLRALMRSNDYRHDPLSRNCPRYAVAARYELSGTENCVWWSNVTGLGVFEGAIDVKYASHSDLLAEKIVAVSGPAWNEHVGVFSWSGGGDDREKVPHRGQPDRWDFPWQVMGGDSDFRSGSMRDEGRVGAAMDSVASSSKGAEEVVFE